MAKKKPFLAEYNVLNCESKKIETGRIRCFFDENEFIDIQIDKEFRGIRISASGFASRMMVVPHVSNVVTIMLADRE